MQKEHSKTSSNSNNCEIALYCPSPAPLPMDAELRNELPWLRS